MSGSNLKVAILGFGTVGSSVARILGDLKPQGLTLTHIYNRHVARKRVDWVPSGVVWTDSIEDVLASDVDVVVELVGGIDPAGEWVWKALQAGKSVVTANKKLIAFDGIELEKLAHAKGGSLLYGAAVAGGIPVIPGLQQGLAGDQITRIEGILNGTCNFILSKMEAGAEFATVLKEAQALGYAEANPSEDVDGFDARAKLVILARLALRADLDPEQIPCRSISEVAAIDFEYARELGCTIRQISRAELHPTDEDLSAGARTPTHGRRPVRGVPGDSRRRCAGERGADAGAEGVSAGVVAGNGKYCSGRWTLWRRCGVLGPWSGRASDGGGGGVGSDEHRAWLAYGGFAEQEDGDWRRISAASLDSAGGAGSAGNYCGDCAGAGGAGNQHPCDFPEAWVWEGEIFLLW